MARKRCPHNIVHCVEAIDAHVTFRVADGEVVDHWRSDDSPTSVFEVRCQECGVEAKVCLWSTKRPRWACKAAMAVYERNDL
jgi:hypothetical protein